MSPKEKAEDLYIKYSNATLAYDSGDHSAAGINNSMLVMHQQTKKCAMIHVDEILNQYESGKFDYKILEEEESNYWQAVKAEFENISL